VPPLEAWEKVLMKLGSKTTVEEIDPHFAMQSCTGCHGGNDFEHENHEEAHEGLIEDPADMEHKACNKCHFEIAETFSDSMHLQLWGEKTAIAARSGAASFGECPQALQDGFKGECASCHASCGDCHISRPDGVGKGFIKNHEFRKKPHQKNQCMACHGSRIAWDYTGDTDAGRQPDAHFAKGWDCMKCHDGNEMHAAANGAPDRYHLDAAPRCEDCHDLADANAFHATHWDDLSCHVCHAQAYNNCAGCHVGGAWKEDEEYLAHNPAVDFRIGINPFPDRRFKYVTLRHAPVAKDTYDNWGAEGTLTTFDALPTWKYNTPHSVRRWTPRTEVEGDAGCGANCHLGSPMGSTDNVGLYLFQQYIEDNWPEESLANIPVVVDGQLPDSWE
jgi:hypothetical protein